MRRVFPTKQFQFKNFPEIIWDGPPHAVCVHRDGNSSPHSALDSLQWGDRAGAFSIHAYVDNDEEGTVYECVDAEKGVHAFHVKEYRLSEKRGWPVTHPEISGKRGDINLVGIEVVENATGHFEQPQRISLLLYIATLLERWPDLDVVEHGSLDPFQRADDVGDALSIPDLKADLDDLLNGREPWRTVGEVATGTRMPESARPKLAIVPASAAAAPTQLAALAKRVDELEASAITQAASLSRLREHLRES